LKLVRFYIFQEEEIVKLQRHIVAAAFQGQCETKWENSGYFPPDCFALSGYNSLKTEVFLIDHRTERMVRANDVKFNIPKTASSWSSARCASVQVWIMMRHRVNVS